MSGVSIKGYKLTTENDRLKCFLCRNNIVDRYYFLSSIKCQTSGLKVTEILSQLSGEQYYVIVSENDVICRCCTSLINTYDKLECLKNEVSSIVQQNLNENYLSKQVEENIVIEKNEELFGAKPDTTSLTVNYDQATLIPNHAEFNNYPKFEKENKSMIQTAFEALQFDLNEFPVVNDKKDSTSSSSSFSEQINVTYSTIPHMMNSFVENDIERQINELSDIDISYINDELSLLPSDSCSLVPNCNLDDIQRNLLNKTDINELLNLNASNNNNSMMNHVILADAKNNVQIERIDEKNNLMDEYCASDDGEQVMSDLSSTAENFFVQIVRETGETSRSVVTLDSGSAQVLKQNWEDVGPE